MAGYQHCNKNTGVPEFYRFTHPISSDYPIMIELFTRRLEKIMLPEEAVLTPLPIDDDISSLSAILLNDIKIFIDKMRLEEINVKRLGIIGKYKKKILDELEEIYIDN